jgi:hypothetical protein
MMIHWSRAKYRRQNVHFQVGGAFVRIWAGVIEGATIVITSVSALTGLSAMSTTNDEEIEEG